MGSKFVRRMRVQPEPKICTSIKPPAPIPIPPGPWPPDQIACELLWQQTLTPPPNWNVHVTVFLSQAAPLDPYHGNYSSGDQFILVDLFTDFIISYATPVITAYRAGLIIGVAVGVAKPFPAGGPIDITWDTWTAQPTGSTIVARFQS